MLLSQLICTLAFDLGLNTPFGKETQMIHFMNTGCFPRPYDVSTDNTNGRTIEERRAVLGCFMVSSVYVTLDTVHSVR